MESGLRGFAAGGTCSRGGVDACDSNNTALDSDRAIDILYHSPYRNHESRQGFTINWEFLNLLKGWVFGAWLVTGSRFWLVSNWVVNR